MGAFSLVLVTVKYFLIQFLTISTALDTITPPQSLSGASTLVSGDGTFELGFFTTGSSKNWCLGVWYKKVPEKTIVWVANRQSPLKDSSGKLMIDSSGQLLILSKSNDVVWSAPNVTKSAETPILRLLDSGNLVLTKPNGVSAETYLWQSFDYLSDTLLPGMKLGWDLKRGIDRRLVSWKSQDDPSPGDFVMEIKLQNNPETIMWKSSTKYYRSGPWNGEGYSGAPELTPNPVFEYGFVSNDDEVYYTYRLTNKSVLSRLVMNQTSYNRQRYTWNEVTQSWVLYSSIPRDQCDTYAICGAYGNCIISGSPICQCLKGFFPKSPERWNLMDWSQGCVRNKPLDCQNGDGFVKFTGLKWPDATNSWVNKSMNLKECKAKCLQNCSCTAYANADITGKGSGCALWFDDLIDIRQFPIGGQDLYVRMHASDSEKKTANKIRIAVLASAAIAMTLGVLLASYYFCRSKVASMAEGTQRSCGDDQDNDQQNDNLELPQFEFATIDYATNGFSDRNKLGEGGFGPVYEGKLADGKQVAVKRLSRYSGQGLHEFKNEVILISKLQHRNLVKLLGYCVQGEEKMLIYEFMHNGSLYSFIFDQRRSKLLDWSKRFNIIFGIARGLLYLHQDSRFRIIHRDLKASNVLLDSEMNPKISDFGTARTFGGDQTEGNTNRVVGTYGYMAPEYATDGLFSVKSDVFSYGVLVLEIISGKKSRGFYHPDHNLNLIGHAWKFWKEKRALELVDASLQDSCHLAKVMRCIHISLLCVQQRAEDRPRMAEVVLMLGSEIVLPQPKEPGFFKDLSPLRANSSPSKLESSINSDIISMIEAR